MQEPRNRCPQSLDEHRVDRFHYLIRFRHHHDVLYERFGGCRHHSYRVSLYGSEPERHWLTILPSVPVYEIWRQATRSDVAATLFIVLLLLAVVFALNATHQTASRLTWSFARDDALFGSRWLGKIDEKQQVPIAALLFNFAIMFIIGCIYLGSTSAFNAFIGTGLILQHVTYAFPAVLLMMRRRSTKWLPESRSFKLPSIVGWVANCTTVAFAVLVLIFYDFPTVIPVTGTSMSKTPPD